MTAMSYVRSDNEIESIASFPRIQIPAYLRIYILSIYNSAHLWGY